MFIDSFSKKHLSWCFFENQTAVLTMRLSLMNHSQFVLQSSIWSQEAMSVHVFTQYIDIHVHSGIWVVSQFFKITVLQQNYKENMQHKVSFSSQLRVSGSLAEVQCRQPRGPLAHHLVETNEMVWPGKVPGTRDEVTKRKRVLRMWDVKFCVVSLLVCSLWRWSLCFFTKYIFIFPSDYLLI